MRMFVATSESQFMLVGASAASPRAAAARQFRRFFRRAPASQHAEDFAHHAPGVARLNHGSFGASPVPVLEAEAAVRAAWRAQPDEAYFSGSLEAELRGASDATAVAMGCASGSVALVENATVATAVIARRWASQLRARPSPAGRSAILLLDMCYKAVDVSVRAICGPAGGEVVHCAIPFPGTTHEAVLAALDAALAAVRPRFALLDHITSQPALLLPAAEMVRLCRDHAVEEVAIDGAHAIGQVPLRVAELGADFYYTNLHKWAYAAGPVTALHAANGELEATTHHTVPSWFHGEGLVQESLWAGTRDYSSAVAAPHALRYLEEWRSADGLDAIEHNRRGWSAAAAALCEAWETPLPAAAECVAAMGMVRLPAALDLASDAPGRPSAGVRATLRERYGVEAAVGGFGREGGMVRLSHAVYNTDSDFQRLKDAIDDMVQ